MQQFFDFVDAARNETPNTDDLAVFARRLAFSGQTLRPETNRTADVSSTGGPTSLSTLLCPLQLVALGWQVPKLAVVGRPAGGIDVMAQVPGYRTSATASELLIILRKSGYANCEAGAEFAPADAQTFEYRQRTGAQAVPALAVASLIAKKAAMGVMRAGLDVRMAPHGNFGADLPTARKNAELFVQVGLKLGIDAVCYFTDGTVPFQPYVGRSEALVALADIFEGRANAWLSSHADLCLGMSLDLTASSGSRAPMADELYGIFRTHLLAHGADPDGFELVVEQTRATHQYAIHADNDGYVSYDLAAIRSVLVAAQQKRGGGFADPAGLVLQAEPDRFVRRGSLLMTARIETDLVEDFYPALAKCVTCSEQSVRIRGAVRG